MNTLKMSKTELEDAIIMLDKMKTFVQAERERIYG
jgi:hypothetical protein